MQKKIVWVNFIFLRKKAEFSDVFSAFYSQRSDTATRSPWSIHNYVMEHYEKIIKYFIRFFLKFSGELYQQENEIFKQSIIH